MNGVGNIASPRLMPGKFAEVVKTMFGGSIDKEDIPAKWEKTIGYPLMKPELKNLAKRLMRDRLLYLGGDFDL